LLDLDHLSRQTLGNQELEREVLGLFIGMAFEQLGRLRASTDPRQRREAAHAINGSARAIGAFSVAQIAGELERGEEPIDGQIAALTVEIEKVCKFIAARLEK
jgi:HPt (histidine-containing phosphotransfer) domain-containing protein